MGFFLQEQAVPNISFGQFTAKGLREDARYRFRDWQAAGAPEGRLGTEEDWKVSGSLLNAAGIRLMQALTARKARENMRTFCDGDSRIYVMEKQRDEENS